MDPCFEQAIHGMVPSLLLDPRIEFVLIDTLNLTYTVLGIEMG